MLFTFYTLSALINFITSLVLGFFVLLRNPKRLLYITFALFSFLIAGWSLGYFFWQLSTDAQTALFWSRFFMSWAIFISVAYLHFVFVLLKINKSYKLFILGSYFLFFLFLVLNLFSNHFITGITSRAMFDFWPVPGILFNIFLPIWFGYVVLATYYLFKYHSRLSGVVKSQIKYLLVGMIVGFTGGSTNYFLWYDIPILPIGNILVSFYVVAVAYAILRYRLMDIRVVFRRLYLYVLAAAFTYILFYLIAWFYIYFFGGIFTPASYLTGLLMAPFFVFLLYNFYNLIQDWANKYFFVSLYSVQESVNRLARELNYLNDLQQIADLIVKTVYREFDLTKAGLIILNKEADKDHQVFQLNFEAEDLNIKQLVFTQVAREFLEKHNQILIADELINYQQDIADGSQSAEIWKNNLEKIPAAGLMPLISGSRLVGLVVLGEKASGNPFSQEDIMLLQTLAASAGIAIDNSLLYEQIRLFNQTLQERVDEQTSELRAKTKHLEKLLKMRSEFLNIASHQLRTPVSVILGTISMFKEGSIDKLPPEKQKQFIDNIYYKSRKLEQIIRDILLASEIDSGHFSLGEERLAVVDVVNLVAEVVKANSTKAQDKDLELVFNKPSEELKIKAHADYLKQALAYVIDNALIYTPVGQVTVDLTEDKGRVMIKISDTGIGIPAEDQDKIFKKFARGRQAVDLYTDGSGLGLFIVLKITEAQPGGQISFESEAGQGSIFILSFPLVQ